MPTPILKYVWKLDNYLISEYTEQLPKQLLEWMNPYLDEKTKEATMRAISPNKNVDYVCKADLKLPVEERVTFKLRPLKVQEQANLRDKMYEIKGNGAKRKESFRTGSMEVDALVLGLRGWSNLKTEDGVVVEFNEKDIPAMLEYLPADVRTELSGKIRGEAELNEGEE